MACINLELMVSTNGRERGVLGSHGNPNWMPSSRARLELRESLNSLPVPGEGHHYWFLIFWVQHQRSLSYLQINKTTHVFLQR